MDAVLSCCEESICASQVSLNVLLVQPAYTRSVLYLFDLSRLYLSYTLIGKPFPGNLLMPSSASSQPSSSHLICPVDSAFAPKKLLAGKSLRGKIASRSFRVLPASHLHFLVRLLTLTTCL